MLSKIQSLGCRGVSGYAVSVECHVSNGLPGFDIVGLPDAAVKEARERVRSAIKTNGMKFSGQPPDGEPRPGGHAQGRHAL